MSPPAPSAAPHAPTIVAAHLAAGHDGFAEVSVTVRYPNGAERAISLPCDVVDRALYRAGVTDIAELLGRPWTALAVTHRTGEPPPA